jgi:hypothetical protein
MPSGSTVGLRWSAPADTSVVAVHAYLALEAHNRADQGGGTTNVTVSTDRATLLMANSPMSTGPDGKPNFDGPLGGAHWFEFRFTCLDSCGAPTPEWLWAYFPFASFDVRDDVPPVGGLVGASADAPTWSGTMAMTLNAADAGSGLYRAVVEVDGQNAVERPLGLPSEGCEPKRSTPGCVSS